MFAKENRQEEHRPWAINIIRAPCQPHEVLDIIPPVATPMWLTEEYAIKALTSVCRMQISLAITPPINDTLINGRERFLLRRINFVAIRSSPYLPSFRRMPARIIDPATGASTCALGSHRCVVYRGVLTRNAITVSNHQIVLVLGLNGNIQFGRIIDRCPEALKIKVKDKRRGKEAVTVYIMRYIPACIRSGWYPQPRTG